MCLRATVVRATSLVLVLRTRPRKCERQFVKRFRARSQPLLPGTTEPQAAQQFAFLHRACYGCFHLIPDPLCCAHRLRQAKIVLAWGLLLFILPRRLVAVPEDAGKSSSIVALKDMIDQPSSSGQGDSGSAPLTCAKAVHELKAQEANLCRRAMIRGVVTWVDPHAYVLQDSTGGIFVETANDPGARPMVGEVWEVDGETKAGDFAPVLRSAKSRFLGWAAMPEPLRPRWDQLENGSLDAQYVELRGVPIAVSENKVVLLLQGGKIEIGPQWNGSVFPRFSDLGASFSLGSIVRVRGCLFPIWEKATGQFAPGKFWIGSPFVAVEQPKPADPFSIPVRQASDLRLFDAGADALQRIKLSGQITHTRTGEAFLLDHESGVRLFTRDAPPLHSGDCVEAVGFPEVGGPSVALREAEVRVTGHAALPKPKNLSTRELRDPKHDAVLVRVEAVLLDDVTVQGERILELQSGPYRFAGRSTSDGLAAKRLRSGSLLWLEGVFSWVDDERPARTPAGFELLLDGPTALTVLHAGPWWTEGRIIAAAVILAGGLGLASIWITLLRRKVEQRTAQLQREIEGRQRAEQRRMLEEERARVAQDLHDELGAGLSEVGLLGALANNPATPPEKKIAYLDQLTGTARSLVTELDEIVWAINPQYDSTSSFATYCSLFAQRFLNLAAIECLFDKADDPPDSPMDSKLRHGIFLAFREALNNVVRHSGASVVRLRLEVAQNELMLTIADNGRGFCEDAAVPGSDGIAGIRRRLESLGGRCTIESRVGHGATVSFAVPLERKDS